MDALGSRLLERRVIAKLATVMGDGFPHLVAVWFLWDDGCILMPTNGTTQKVRNLERDRRASVLIDVADAGFQVSGLTVMGHVDIIRGAPARGLNGRIHRKYLTEEALAVKEVGEYLSTDDVTIQLHPDRSFSWDQSVTSYGQALHRHGGCLPLE